MMIHVSERLFGLFIINLKELQYYDQDLSARGGL